jgi:uncharacterized protein
LCLISPYKLIQRRSTANTLFTREKTFFVLKHRRLCENAMLIGVMSDSHDNLPLIERAVSFLNQQKVGLVLHAGDFVAPFVAQKLKKLNCELIGVFGNNDGDHVLLKKRFSETTNCTLHDRFTVVTVDHYKVALLHGHENELLDAIVDSGYFDAVVHGHSHNCSIEKRGKTLTINPGELCGYLTGKATIALLDTIMHEARIVEL